MFRLTSLAAHLPAFGASAALHATLWLVVPGAPAIPAVPGMEVEIEVAPDDLAVATAAPVAQPDEPAHAAPMAWTTHVHPYPVSATHDATPHDPSLVHTAEDLDHDHDHDHDEAPRFTMAVGSGAADTHGVVAVGGGATGSQGAPSGRSSLDVGPLDEHAVDAPARLAHGAPPSYPEDARAARIEGDVRLELVVSAGGEVESARVVHGVAPGLDASAIQASRLFHFSPAVKDGRPVRVRMGWSVQFRLR